MSDAEFAASEAEDEALSETAGFGFSGWLGFVAVRMVKGILQ